MSDEKKPVTDNDTGDIQIFTIRNPADFVEMMTGVRPRSGRCILCGKSLTPQDVDHSVCNSCWTETFACTICGDESGDCEHRE